MQDYENNGTSENRDLQPNTELPSEETEETAPKEAAKEDDATCENSPENGYSRPYHANQYPNGQQNRQYLSNGQPPMGNSHYPYANANNRASGMEPPPTGKKTGLFILIALLCAVVVIAGIGIVGFFANERPVGNIPSEGLTAVPPLTTENGPSINIISDTASAPNQTAAPNGALSSQEIYRVIRESSVGILGYSKSTKQLVSEGSGVIFGEHDGKYTYIITCAHVISPNDMNYKVMLFDDALYSAEIVGYDARTDIGVLKIEATGLKQADFGDAIALEVGQPVYAIGNPGGSEFAGSFTNGIISAIARPVASQTGYTTKCIQHTAAINPGNSGGALVNDKGQVIGINSMKIVETEFEGMGFAVPANIVNSVVKDLVTYGYIPNRAKLGITYISASNYETYSIIMQIKGMPKGSIIINSISADSDLAATLAEEGDMIVAVNGKRMEDSDLLASMVENGSVGDVLTLSLVRVDDDYTLHEFTVKVKLVADLGSAARTTSSED